MERKLLKCELCGIEIDARTAVMNKDLCNDCKPKIKGLSKCGWCERWRKFHSCEFCGSTCKECFEEYGNSDDDVFSEKEWKKYRTETLSWKKKFSIPYPEKELIQHDK